MNIGILALQGAFFEHEKMIHTLGHTPIELRQSSDIRSLDGLILPGGESTVQRKLLHELGMFTPLKEMILTGLPTLGTCAGLILLAKNLSNDSSSEEVVDGFATLPVLVRRNAYGRQLGSFRTNHHFEGIGDVDMTFIRAPYIERASEDVSVLSRVDDHIVAVAYKNQIGLSFHPELDEDLRIHQYFLNKAKAV